LNRKKDTADSDLKGFKKIWNLIRILFSSKGEGGGKDDAGEGVLIETASLLLVVAFAL